MALTKEQRAAISRANGAKSRGPKTPQGKAVSSRNALKAGFTAKKFIIPELESEQEFDRFSLMLRKHHRPRNIEEALCVDRMIVVLWRIRRVNLEMTIRANDYNERHSFVSSSYLGNLEDVEKLTTIEEKLSRQHQQLTKELNRLQGASVEQETGTSPLPITIQLLDD